jgi:hypothetical protein
MKSAQTIVVYACRFPLGYQAIQGRVSEPQAGHFNCIDCGSEVHSWFGVYDYADWTHRKEPKNIRGSRLTGVLTEG